MPVESDFDNIDSLDPNFPLNDDPVSEGPQHLRGIKEALQGNVTGDDNETRLLVGALVALLMDVAGALVTGQVKVTAAAPVAADDLARKDYVDAAIAAAIAGILAGATFTGPISAPSVTEV